MKSKNGLYEAHVVIRGRVDATEVTHNSDTYIEGRPGTEYVLRFRNRSGKRVLILPSVDGLSVLDGKEAGIESPGYVVPAHGTVEIPGWKVDNSTAAKFVFAERGSRSSNPAKKTYAEQQGANPANIGVIGFAVFTEKEAPPPPPPPTPVYVPYPVPTPYPVPSSPWQWPTHDPYRITYGSVCNGTTTLSGSSARGLTVGSTVLMDSMPSAQMTATGGLGEASLNSVAASVASTDKGVGTGFGDATKFVTNETTFVRANHTVPDAVITLIYDTLTQLQKMGVPVEHFRPNRGPSRNAFPASPQLTGTGCPPPPGWSKRKRR